MCGGTLYKTNLVLTAAHCILSTNPSSYKVYLGLHDRNSLSSAVVASVARVNRVNYFK
jgi:secreted trypsin-like serine protease